MDDGQRRQLALFTVSEHGLCEIFAGSRRRVVAPIEGVGRLFGSRLRLMVASEAASPTRGRPTVFTDEVLQRAAGFSYARSVRSRRGAQDLVYRMFAIAAIEHYCEAFPEKADTLWWLLRPRRRHTLLSELGRVARPRSGAKGELLWAEREVSVLIEIALEVAEKRPSTKDGVAMVRALRRRSA